MKNLIIGTAGHIDHGKTTLIKALTGISTDRLKEEQKRGISIELGFTFFDLPSGLRAGIIDVPGHEKFIKNMLAGAIGMDLVALVVAADEGMMPQSIEHMQILDLLGLEKGIIILTKVDGVDAEWLDLVEEETKDQVKGTFLEGAPVVRVDSVSGFGLDTLKETIDQVAKEIPEKVEENQLARLPIDRAFTLSGFGTIVTGTCLSGSFKVGDEVQVYPSRLMTKIRSLQVHDKDVAVAHAGQRVAMNLTNVKKEEVARGKLIAPPESMIPTKILDVEIKTIDLPYDLSNRTRLRLYIGTAEVFCRIILLDRDSLGSRETVVAQLKLEEEVVARKSDRFILRIFSPMITIGGGKIVDSNPKKKKRFNEEDIKLLEAMVGGDSKEITEAIIKEHSKEYPSLAHIAKLKSDVKDSLEEEVEALEEEGKVVVVKLTKESYVIHQEYAKDLLDKIRNDIRNYHKLYPLRMGMSKEEIRSKYFNVNNKKVGELFIDAIIGDSNIEDKKEFLKLEDFQIGFTDKQIQIRDKILSSYEGDEITSPRLEDIFEIKKQDRGEIEEVFNSLIISGALVRLDQDIVIKTEDLNHSIKIISKFLSENHEISLAQARDLLKTNRKIALAILENMDRKGITKREGEARILV